jgi:hypothetical protein
MISLLCFACLHNVVYIYNFTLGQIARTEYGEDFMENVTPYPTQCGDQRHFSRLSWGVVGLLYCSLTYGYLEIDSNCFFLRSFIYTKYVRPFLFYFSVSLRLDIIKLYITH